MDCSWIVPESIIIVESPNNRLYIDNESSIPKAYIVFGDNKKSLENAHRWAGKDAVDREISGDTEFTFEILECAGHSSQGGKLSFWSCRIRNTDENIDVSVGVNSEILCMLLKETTFVNGVCRGNVILAKYDGQLGVVCKGTKSYSDAIQSQHKKDSLKKGKTTKWEKGFEYRTQSTSDIWIGDAYRPLTVETDYFNKYTYDLRNIGKKFHVIMETWCVESNSDEGCNDCAWEHTKFVKSFPSRQKNDSIYFSDKSLEKLICSCVSNGVTKTLSGGGYKSDPWDCLISVDGKITDDMMNNFKIAFDKMIDHYGGSFRNRKHIVICDDGEHVFSDVKGAYDFIVQKLNEFREVK